GMQLPTHYDFEVLRYTPESIRNEFHKWGWDKVVAFHTSKPMHRVHYEITTQAAKSLGANLLIQPVSGVGKPGDLAYYSRVHCYQAIIKQYPKYLAALSLVPQAMRMAGPREAIHNMIIRQNYGCSHFIIGPEHASPPGVRAGGQRFYEMYSAQAMVEEFQSRLDIKMCPVEEMGYCAEQGAYISCKTAQLENKKTQRFTEKEFNNALEHDHLVPNWYSYPDVIAELSKVRLSRKNKGLALFFTGLSGSGKSTLAKLIYARFIEQGDRPVTLLDGDVVRMNLSRELTFSKEHRDLNVKRIGYVASEITKNRGVAICAPIAPYEKTREFVREAIEEHGAFIEIHVATPLDVCEGRDRKGMYAKARKGIIKHFTGISDPYEIPQSPEIKIDTTGATPVECAQKIMLKLFKEGYIR
ncbi:Sulfate adenylyltransferase / Adenylylsulfate kinase, partial [hydrothermal vent metagenome]